MQMKIIFHLAISKTRFCLVVYTIKHTQTTQKTQTTVAYTTALKNKRSKQNWEVVYLLYMLLNSFNFYLRCSVGVTAHVKIVEETERESKRAERENNCMTATGKLQAILIILKISQFNV